MSGLMIFVQFFAVYILLIFFIFVLKWRKVEHSGLLSAFKDGLRNVLGAPNLLSQTFPFVKPSKPHIQIADYTLKPPICQTFYVQNSVQNCTKYPEKI